ncbi:MAG: class I SAM-dependent methyltransferase [Propionibacteriaceae bacterium]|nr:class I SAM-dependent methyltransferase [Propionibacteriaceae bacterium]
MIDPTVDVHGINDYVYGDEWSRLWQIHFAKRPDTDSAVRCLAEWAGGGDVLELGVGSGRVAIPLAARCRSVYGIDTSEGMLRELRAREGGGRVRVIAADAAAFDLGDARFDLIYFISWGLQMLLSEESKRNCFERVAKHLRREGVFVVEGMHPEGYPFGSGGLGTLKIDRASTILNGELHRPQEQMVLNSLIFLVDNQLPRVHTTASHYVATDRLDEMAAVAGLRLEAAFSTWECAPLTSSSPSMIRIYRKGESGV